MSQIKTWCAVALCALLAWCALPAGAESGNADLFARDLDGSGNEFISSAVVSGDTLYMLGSGLYRYRVGDEEPTALLTSAQLWAYPTQASGEESSEPFYSPQYLVGGDDITLFALDAAYGMLGTWNGKRFDWIQQLDWADMTRDQGDWTETRSVQSPLLVDGWLYMLVMKDFDNWGDFELRRYDLANGEFTTLSVQNAKSFAPYTSGKLVALRRDPEDWSPTIVVIDAVTGAVERTLFETTTVYNALGGLAYDAATDTVYVAQNNAVTPVEDGSLGEPVAYLSGEARDDFSAAMLPSGHYAVCTYGGVFVRSLDPQYRPDTVLRLSGAYGLDDVTSAFMQDNPDITVQMLDGYLSTGPEIIDAMLSQEDSVDILRFTSTGGFKGLRDKGYLGDLSASPELVAAVEAMYPQIRDAVLVDGKLYGLPVELQTDLWRVDVDALERLGLGGMPETMLDFLDLIERWIDEDLESANPGWLLFDPWVDKEQVLNQLVAAYLVRYDRPDAPLPFDTPQLRAALERWEQLPEFSNDRGDNYSYDEAVLFSFYGGDPFGQRYYGNPEYNAKLVPSPAFVAGEDPLVHWQISMYALNPNSPNSEAALRYLAYMAEHGEARARYQLRPDLNEPVPDPKVISDKQYVETELADARERLETADEADKKDIESAIVDYQNWLTDMERYYWQISAEGIAAYRALAPFFVLNIDSVIVNNDSGTLAELFEDMQRYAQGQTRIDEFLRGLDKKAKMIFYEGQ